MKCQKCNHEFQSGHRCPACGAAILAKADVGTSAIKNPVILDAPLPDNSGNGFVSDFLSFRSMITETYIKVIFVLGLLFIGLLYLGCVVVGFKEFGFFGGLCSALACAIGMAFMVLFFRIFCEILIVVFKIYSELKSINSGIAKENLNK